jgi:osmotically-inducible protein OsmY
MVQRLLSSPYVALHDLRCEFCDGRLTLRGRVPTLHTKQIAISLARELEGVVAIVDRMEVTEPAAGPSTT